MQVHELKPGAGSRHRVKRLGRGPGSGHGKTSGRGHKGQRSRSGSGVRPGFEGGQMPLQRRIPKRGFNNPLRAEPVEVNVGKLNQFEDGVEVTPELLRSTGIIKHMRNGIKMLGMGELRRSLIVKAHAFSQSAVTKIEAAGGKAEVIE